jgi:hypothetical protein
MEEEYQRQEYKQKPEYRKSTYSDFMGEAQGLIQLKRGYEDTLLGNLEDAGVRERIIRYATILVSELGNLPSEDERQKYNQMITDMKKWGDSIFNKEAARDVMQSLEFERSISREIRTFRDMSQQFLQDWNIVKEMHNAGIQSVRQKSDLERLYDNLEIKNRSFKNSYGVTISPEMELFARGCYMRAMNGYNNVIMVIAPLGRGKTTFVESFQTTLAPMFGLSFDVNYNFFLKETREYCERALRMAEPYTPFSFDEAGNQFNARLFWNQGQNDLLNAMALLRWQGYTVTLCWKSIKELDKNLLEGQGIALVYISEKGMAQVKMFNKNPHGETFAVDKKLKKKVIYESGELGDIMNNEKNTIMRIPFYPIPKELWEIYLAKKTGTKLTMSDLSGQGGGAQDLYLFFLTQIPVGATVITNKALHDFGVKHFRPLSLRALGKQIAKATGRRLLDFYQGDPLDPEKDVIRIDDYLNEYINRLKASKAGAAEYKKEGGEEAGGR